MKKYQLILIISGLLISVGNIQAQDNDSFSAYRQKLMKSNANHMAMIGDVLKNNLPFKNQITSHAKIVEMNSLMTEDAFAKKITSGRTDTKPQTWDDWAAFVAAAKKTADAAKALAETSESGTGNVMGNVKAIGQACGSCHRQFRKPKGQRFAR